MTHQAYSERNQNMHSKECIGMFWALTCVNKSSYQHIYGQTNNIIFTIPDNRKKNYSLNKRVNSKNTLRERRLKQNYLTVCIP